MKLYYHNLSGHSHRARLFLSLLGVDYEPLLIDFGKREHKSDTFLAMNPFGQVPVLVDGKTVVSNVDLAGYPNVLLWLRRMEAQPGFVAFDKTPVGLAA